MLTHHCSFALQSQPLSPLALQNDQPQLPDSIRTQTLTRYGCNTAGVALHLKNLTPGRLSVRLRPHGRRRGTEATKWRAVLSKN